MKLTSELCSFLPWQKQRIWGSVNTMSCHMHFMWYSMGKVVCQMEMIVTYAQTQQLLFWKLGPWNWKGTVLREAANEWSPQGRALYQDSCVFLVFLFIWTALALRYAITSQVKPWSKLIPSRKGKESKAVDGMPVCFLLTFCREAKDVSHIPTCSPNATSPFFEELLPVQRGNWLKLEVRIVFLICSDYCCGNLFNSWKFPPPINATQLMAAMGKCNQIGFIILKSIMNFKKVLKC